MNGRVALARRQGLTEEQIGELRDFRDSRILTPREKAVVWYAEVMSGDHTQASQELFDELRHHFSESEIIDLGFRITAFVGYGRLIRALGLEKGGYCPLPTHAPADGQT
jgi:alkylhydroperoxidase family enzyme